LKGCPTRLLQRSANSSRPLKGSVRCLKVISTMMVNEKIKLSCSKDCVSELFKKSIDWPLHSVWFGKNKLKGRIKNNNFTLWQKTRFVRGWPMVIAKEKYSGEDGDVLLTYSILPAFPFKYFNLKPLSITLILLTMILSWVGSILSLIFEVNFLIIVLGPLCVSSIFSALCIFTYFYICKPEIKETKKILDNLFIKYRSSVPAALVDR
jgi:hypothetical protein